MQQDEVVALGKSKDFKILALTLELAHMKRIKFGKASEAPLAGAVCSSAARTDLCGGGVR